MNDSVTDATTKFEIFFSDQKVGKATEMLSGGVVFFLKRYTEFS